MKDVSVEEFGPEVLDHDGPVVVDFWASWCGPCRVALPKLEELDEANENVKFVKVDIEAAGEIAGEYKIRSIPTFLVFEGGEETERIVADVAKLEEVVSSLDK